MNGQTPKPSTYKRVYMTPTGKTRTKQSMAADCDINNIMKKYQRTGLIDHVAKHGAEYAEASSLTYHDAMNLKTKADQMFSDLPSTTRKRFHHDPAQFLEFVQDDENLEEMEELGLLNEDASARLRTIREAAEENPPPETETPPPTEG